MNPFDEIDDTLIKESTTIIEIWIETTGRKKNTFISGWNLTDTELKEHIKTIKKKNGCNGTLKEITINDDSTMHKVIQLQGNHIDYMNNYLKEQMIDPDLIRIKG